MPANPNNKRLIIILLYFIYTAGAAYVAIGQTPLHDNLSTADGLAGQVVYSVFQSRDHHIWVATDKGLSRFDGLRFHSFTHRNGLLDNEVFRTSEDPEGRLWICYFNQKPGFFLKDKFYPGPTALPKATEYFFTHNKYGLWFAYPNGKVFLWQGQDNLLQATLHAPVISLFTRQDQVLLVTREGIKEIGLLDGDIRFNNICTFPFNKNLQNRLQANSTQHFFICLNQELLIFDQHFNLTHTVPLPYLPFSIHTDRNDRLWICWNEGGFSAAVIHEGKIKIEAPVLTTYLLNGIFIDQENVMWLPTRSRGLLRLDAAGVIFWNQSNGMPERYVTCLTTDQEGHIWAGFNQSYFSQYQIGKSWSHFHIPTGSGNSNRILQICPLAQPQHCLVAGDNGLWEWKNGRFLRQLLSEPVKKVQLLSPFKAAVATAFNTRIIDLSGGKDTVIYKGRTSALGLDADRQLWIAGTDSLMLRNPAGAIRRLDSQIPQELHSRITTICAGPSGQVWLGNTLNQVLLFQDGRYQGTLPEIPGEYCSQITYDPGGFFWICTNKGLHQFSLEGTLLKSFTTRNGLISDEVTSAVITSDQIWAATSEGISRIPRISNNAPGNFKTRITAISIGNQVLDTVPGHLQLPFRSPSLNIQVTGMTTQSRGHFLFQYKIFRKWLPWPLLTFENLLNAASADTTTITAAQPDWTFPYGDAPGEYSFSVRAINNADVLSDFPATLSIQVMPPWWRILWVQILLMTLFICSIRKFYVWQHTMAADQMRLEKEKTELSIQVVRAQINPHFIYNCLNSIQHFIFTKEVLLANKYLSQFSRLIRQTLSFSRKDFIPLADEIDYIENYLALEQLRFGEKMSYEIHIAPDLLIKQHTINTPTLLLQPLIENAVKHGIRHRKDKNGLIKITVTEQHGQIFWSLEDNGPGMYAAPQKDENKSGFGIPLIRERIQALNQLYPLQIQWHIQDKSKHHPAETGTLVTLQFCLTATTQRHLESLDN